MTHNLTRSDAGQSRTQNGSKSVNSSQRDFFLRNLGVCYVASAFFFLHTDVVGERQCSKRGHARYLCGHDIFSSIILLEQISIENFLIEQFSIPHLPALIVRAGPDGSLSRPDPRLCVPDQPSLTAYHALPAYKSRFHVLLSKDRVLRAALARPSRSMTRLQ